MRTGVKPHENEIFQLSILDIKSAKSLCLKISPDIGDVSKAAIGRNRVEDLKGVLGYDEIHCYFSEYYSKKSIILVDPDTFKSSHYNSLLAKGWHGDFHNVQYLDYRLLLNGNIGFGPDLDCSPKIMGVVNTLSNLIIFDDLSNELKDPCITKLMKIHRHF
ncbi:hypothetical protein DFA_03538 [Cavenderia fasciculata]|uniref:Uncharacterized protein n=1 Tax=Cavenderia fasciculata TaxID=261658 RepID=F4PHV5_CACFS|nr:uncharacterized protein DFA_03538 [Cavenderia fasciculata]EGG25289.1 hypothetical protein DFA_03538 [Cavenderia fasciculata]|eukprot:XP_004363140.1 hypothetical protein DFA_03538 [Cavenderia fasciculata]